MRYNKKDCTLTVFVVGIALCCGAPLGMAAEDRQASQAAAATVIPEPETPDVYYETVGDYSLGYRWVSDKDSVKAAEYIYPHSSATFDLDFLSCPLPYRYHVNTEFLSDYDFYTDAGFAYKDLILFRDILVGVQHNLNHYDYQFPGEPPGIVYVDRDAEDLYYKDFVSNLSSLRLKVPDFPLHTFLRHRFVEQDSRVEQRFVLGTVGGNLTKVSESRDTDWESNALTLGANSHAGPVEIEYAHDLAKFNPEGSDNILYDVYPASTSATSPRPGDTYPHNVVPETESSANSLKLHSSYTGSVVASATLGNLYQKNNYSDTESSTWKQAVDFSWIPDPVVGLFFKFRHKDVDLDTPDSVTLLGLNNTLNYPVREGVSYDKDVFTLSSRYKPLHILSLYATYELALLERQDIGEWPVLPGHTNINSFNFTAQANPFDQLKVKASYEFKNYSQPEYNDTPDNANKLRLTTTYTPASWATVDLEYVLSVTERSSLRYLNNNPSLLLDLGERDGHSNQFLASLLTALSSNVSLTTSWFYQRWEVEQDLTYRRLNSGGGLPYLDAGVPYTDEANSFSLALCYIPRKDITVGAGITYTIIEGDTGYDDVVGGAPFSLASFSALKAEETVFTLDLTKKLSKEWEVGLKSYVGNYNDRAYGLLDGNVFSGTCNLRRYF